MYQIKISEVSKAAKFIAVRSRDLQMSRVRDTTGILTPEELSGVVRLITKFKS